MSKCEVSEQVMLAQTDALRDIAEGYGLAGEENKDLVPALFGSAYIGNHKSDVAYIANIIVEDPKSYNEAVGSTYLRLIIQYPCHEGWFIDSLHLERVPIYIEAGSYDGVESYTACKTIRKTSPETNDGFED